jgi:2-polyprenyl-6-methoxyphenol hydroxylase-like FAD-dependent oxidoreductase
MGIEEYIRDASYDIHRLRLLGEDGGAKADVSVDAIRRIMGNESASLPRGDLVKAIFETIGDTTEVIFNDSISALDQASEGVHVTFERNPPRTFDLVVGADGLHSTVADSSLAQNIDSSTTSAAKSQHVLSTAIGPVTSSRT